MMRQDDGTNAMDFTYDANGKAIGFAYNDALYFYLYNLQGDVVAMMDEDGAIVAEYTYDAYGNILSATGALAGINPIRYRGYYYDSETQLYYLQSRYYNPEWGRFINADAYAIAGNILTANNMYAYCNGNPVMFVDLDGKETTVPNLFAMFVTVVTSFLEVFPSALLWGKEALDFLNTVDLTWVGDIYKSLGPVFDMNFAKMFEDVIGFFYQGAKSLNGILSIFPKLQSFDFKPLFQVFTAPIEWFIGVGRAIWKFFAGLFADNQDPPDPPPTITVPVTGVSVSPTSVSLRVGGTQNLQAQVRPTNASDTHVTWSSSNASVASVDSSGRVSAKAVGTATITVTTRNGSFTATCAVTVTAATVLPTSITVRSKTATGRILSDTSPLHVYAYNGTNSGMNNVHIAVAGPSGAVTTHNWNQSPHNTNFVNRIGSSDSFRGVSEGITTAKVNTDAGGLSATFTIIVISEYSVKSSAKLIMPSGFYMGPDITYDPITQYLLSTNKPVTIYGSCGNWFYVGVDVNGTMCYGFVPKNCVGKNYARVAYTAHQSDTSHLAILATSSPNGFVSGNYSDITATQMLHLLQQSAIFVYRGNGSAGGESFISGGDGGNGYTLLRTNDVLGLSSGALNNARLVVYAACRSGMIIAPHNLATATANRGAQCVIGFEDALKCHSADMQGNTWTVAFQNAIADGYSIDVAINVARSAVWAIYPTDPGGTDSVVFYGNTLQSF